MQPTSQQLNPSSAVHFPRPPRGARPYYEKKGTSRKFASLKEKHKKSSVHSLTVASSSEEETEAYSSKQPRLGGAKLESREEEEKQNNIIWTKVRAEETLHELKF